MDPRTDMHPFSATHTGAGIGSRHAHSLRENSPAEGDPAKDSPAPSGHRPDRRSFSIAAAALSATALLSGCRSSETKPARDATLLHNRAVRDAVAELEGTMNAMDEHLGQFNAENWQDALSNLQTATIRMHNSIEELKHALGYAEPA